MITIHNPPKPSLAHSLGACVQGSHRIEALLYRDNDLAAALPWAVQLLTDYKTLVAKLQDASAYTPSCIWYGIQELAVEVAKKKISSEEETWSDLSILIFHNNLEVREAVRQVAGLSVVTPACRLGSARARARACTLVDWQHHGCRLAGLGLCSLPGTRSF